MATNDAERKVAFVLEHCMRTEHRTAEAFIASPQWLDISRLPTTSSAWRRCACLAGRSKAFPFACSASGS